MDYGLTQLSEYTDHKEGAYLACKIHSNRSNRIARNLGHETPRAITRGNLKTDRDAEVYRDLCGHSRKMANISLRLKENKNVRLKLNRLIYYGANYVKIATK